MATRHYTPRARRCSHCRDVRAQRFKRLLAGCKASAVCAPGCKFAMRLNQSDLALKIRKTIRRVCAIGASLAERALRFSQTLANVAVAKKGLPIALPIQPRPNRFDNALPRRRARRIRRFAVRDSVGRALAAARSRLSQSALHFAARSARLARIRRGARPARAVYDNLRPSRSPAKHVRLSMRSAITLGYKAMLKRSEERCGRREPMRLIPNSMPRPSDTRSPASRRSSSPS